MAMVFFDFQENSVVTRQMMMTVLVIKRCLSIAGQMLLDKVGVDSGMWATRSEHPVDRLLIPAPEGGVHKEMHKCRIGSTMFVMLGVGILEIWTLPRPG
jgi:hypothetical protein